MLCKSFKHAALEEAMRHFTRQACQGSAACQLLQCTEMCKGTYHGEGDQIQLSIISRQKVHYENELT